MYKRQPLIPNAPKDCPADPLNFSKIEFSYVLGENVLKDISFNVKSGEKIAIVGSTGSGKTSIVNLLSRFYDPQNGTIELDNINIKNLDVFSLRSRIALVLQDVFLFADTLLNNITLWNKSISFDNVVNAAKKIGIHDFIMSLPNGYNYNVRERGVMLSQGQRQLISFLRAYLKHPSILILDEATSSIDSNSEELIQNATKKITENTKSPRFRLNSKRLSNFTFLSGGHSLRKELLICSEGGHCSLNR